jgi:hypothetical protein
MALKKTELYRGFNIFTEALRPDAWVFSIVEVPSELGERSRPPQQGRMPGEHASREAALAAARQHIDRIQHNRRNRVTGSE